MKKVDEIIKSIEGVDENKVKELLKSCKSEKISRSECMKELYRLGFDRSEIRDLMNGSGIRGKKGGEISYNWCNNVLVEEFGELRGKRGSDKGESKSSIIERLYRENNDIEVREIVEYFIKKGVYVNNNMVYSIIRKLKKKDKEEVSK